MERMFKKRRRRNYGSRSGNPLPGGLILNHARRDKQPIDRREFNYSRLESSDQAASSRRHRDWQHSPNPSPIPKSKIIQSLDKRKQYNILLTLRDGKSRGRDIIISSTRKSSLEILPFQTILHTLRKKVTNRPSRVPLVRSFAFLPTPVAF